MSSCIKHFCLTSMSKIASSIIKIFILTNAICLKWETRTFRNLQSKIETQKSRCNIIPSVNYMILTINYRLPVNFQSQKCQLFEKIQKNFFNRKCHKIRKYVIPYLQNVNKLKMYFSSNVIYSYASIERGWNKIIVPNN